MDPPSTKSAAPSPSAWRWVLAFLLVGAAWGLTTPFMRRAAVKRNQRPPPPRPILTDASAPWIKRKSWTIIYAVVDLLRNPAYAIPLLLNLTGSVWFFLLVGQAGKNEPRRLPLTPIKCAHRPHSAELSLTVPITNSLAFLFTVLGEWWAEGKVISRGTVHSPKLSGLVRLFIHAC